MYGVETRVGTDLFEHLGIVVADGADVELLGPAGLGIHDGLVVEEGAAELLELFGARGNAHEHFLENKLDLKLFVVGGIEGLEPVVRELAAIGGKVVVALLKGFLQVGVGVDFHAGGLAELLQICFVGLGILDGHCLVGTPCGNYLGAERFGCNLFVPAQVVCGVVGGADHVHVEFAYQRLAAEFRSGQLGVALFEYLPGGGGAEELVYSEYPAQLEVGPVIQGVTHCIGHRLSPLLEGLPGVVFASCEVILAHTVATHGAPFIVVAIVTVHQPQLCDVAELDVLGNLLGHKMAVVVDDVHFLRVLVVEFAGGLRLEHEIGVDKAHFICVFRFWEGTGRSGPIPQKDYWLV